MVGSLVPMYFYSACLLSCLHEYSEKKSEYYVHH